MGDAETTVTSTQPHGRHNGFQTLRHYRIIHVKKYSVLRAVKTAHTILSGLLYVSKLGNQRVR